MIKIRNKKAFAFLALNLTAIIWGGGFITSQMALDAKLSPGLIMVFRFALAALLLYIVFRKQLVNFTKHDFIMGAIAGGMLFAAFYIQIVGLVYTSPSNNAFLTSTNVVIVPFITWIMLGEKPKLKSIFSAFICLLGIFALTYAKGQSFGLGDLLTLLSAFIFALHITYIGKKAPAADVIKLAFVQIVFAWLFNFLAYTFQLIMKFDYLPTMSALKTGLPSLIYLGILSTAVCYLLQTFAQRKISPGIAAIILCTEALWGALFSILFGFEKLTLGMVVGGILIILSTVLVEYRKE